MQREQKLHAATAAALHPDVRGSRCDWKNRSSKGQVEITEIVKVYVEVIIIVELQLEVIIIGKLQVLLEVVKVMEVIKVAQVEATNST